MRFIYAEIFERHCYEQHGIALPSGATVIDVGANIGLFALRVKQLDPAARLYCFEPVPPTYACLVQNLERQAGVATFNVALAERSGSVAITYYERSPGNSTMYPESKPAEASSFARHAPLAWLWSFDKLSTAALALLYPVRRPLLHVAFQRLFRKVERFECPAMTLDQLVETQSLSTVDLLKIDVEGAERGVLAGLSDQNLLRVRQLIVEVSPAHKSWLPALTERLRANGFTYIALESMVPSSDPVTDA
ncbi:MAG: FkbM family methyltransferase, partial [Myxococcaceae bacterium]|nr:FkbM family methyltransferase [Myxococcaceae bacterium]